MTSVVSGNGDPPSLYTPASLRTSYHPPPWRSHTSATVTHSLYELLDYALLLQLKPITLSRQRVGDRQPLAPLDVFIYASLVSLLTSVVATLRKLRSDLRDQVDITLSTDYDRSGSIEPMSAGEIYEPVSHERRERYVRRIGAEIASEDYSVYFRSNDYSRKLLSLLRRFPSVKLDDLEVSVDSSLDSFPYFFLFLFLFILARKHALRTTPHRPTTRYGTRL